MKKLKIGGSKVYGNDDKLLESQDDKISLTVEKQAEFTWKPEALRNSTAKFNAYMRLQTEGCSPSILS